MKLEAQKETIEVVDKSEEKAPIADGGKAKKKRILRVADVLDSSLGATALIFYLLFCSFYSGTAPSGFSNWAIYWTVLFLPSIPTGIIRSIAHRSFGRAPIAQIALFAFLFPSLYTGQFHPNWVVLLIIPFYYAIFMPIQRLVSGKEK